MGNMLPCLVVQGTKTTLPVMKPNKRIYSPKLLMKALHKLKKRSKIASRSPWEAEGAAEGEAEVKSIIRVRSTKASPRRTAACHGHGGGGGGHRKGVVRVKVVLTKEEAARLLSLTVEGQKSAAQIMAEIKRMEARRATASGAAWRPALASIPEESW